MTGSRRPWLSLIQLVLPPSALMAGVALVSLSNDIGMPSDALLRAALVISAIAPLAVGPIVAGVAPGLDFGLFASAAMLTSIGMIFLYGLAVAPGPDQSFYGTMATRQGLFTGAGFLAMIAGAIVAKRLDAVARFPFSLLFAALGLMIVTAAAGETVNGARLWLDLGPLRFQPSEVARLLLVLFVAGYIYERRHLVAATWSLGPIELPPAPYLLPVAGAVLTAAAVLAFQNDLGMAAVVVIGAIAIVAGVLQTRVATFLSASLLGISFVAAYLTISRVHDRVATWLDPWLEPMGRGFQFVTAEYVLASGGVVGATPATAVGRIPEVHTDFVVTGIAGQLGLLASAATLALGAIVVVRSLINATRAANEFAGLVAAGQAVVLGIQLLLIAGGTLRVLPLTGVTFPLVSYGGTSLLVTLFSLGLILGIGARSTTRGSANNVSD
jgi:cell division protein FtsW (lipid II flippase)